MDGQAHVVPARSEKVAFVTGGSKRIGAEICHYLSASGFGIIVHAYRSIVKCKELVDEINRSGGCAEMVIGDLCEAESRDAVISAVLGTKIYQGGGGIDLLVNSASLFTDTKSLDALQQATAREAMFALHVDAPRHLGAAFRESLAARNGSIINIIDALLERPGIGYADYSASKRALADLTIEQALESAPEIRVNGIGPGAILASRSERGLEQQIAELVPLQRWGEPADLAATVVFLAESNYITGQIINVDGGLSLNR
jgi:pteridine reductase